MEVNVYKCYLVEVVDSRAAFKGNPKGILFSEFEFVNNRKEAKEIGNKAKKMILEKHDIPAMIHFICPSCGKFVCVANNFCRHCGAKLEWK